MPAPKRTPTPRKSRSGPNIPDAQRTTAKVTLRLSPEAAEDLDALAERWRASKSDTVARAVEYALTTEED